MQSFNLLINPKLGSAVLVAFYDIFSGAPYSESHK